MDSDLRNYAALEAEKARLVHEHKHQAEAVAKAQRRADLITLTAAAMPTATKKAECYHDLTDGAFEGMVAAYAVDLAEAALALIEERTK